MIKETKQIYSTNERFIGWKHNTCNLAFENGCNTKPPDPSLLIDYVAIYEGNESVNYGVLAENAPLEHFTVKYWREHAHRCSCCARVADNSVNYEAKAEEVYRGYQVLIDKKTLKYLLDGTGWILPNRFSPIPVPDPSKDELPFVVYVLSNGYVSEPTKANLVNWERGKNHLREHYIVAWKVVDVYNHKKELLKFALSEEWTEWNPNCELEHPDLPEGTEVIFMNRDGFISIPYAFDQTRWTWGKDSENDKIAYKIVHNGEND
jgi:hypothetical protein